MHRNVFMPFHGVKKIVLVLIAMMLVMSGCTANSTYVKIDDVNSYYVATEEMCERAETYIRNHNKLNIFYTQNNDAFSCDGWRNNFIFHLGIGDNMIWLRLRDDNVVQTELDVTHLHQFVYIKDGVEKFARMSMRHDIEIVNGEVTSNFGDIYLMAGDTGFQFRYDEEKEIFINQSWDKQGKELRFTADLQAKLVRFYHETIQNKLSDEEAKSIADALQIILEESAGRTSTDITNVKTINDIAFDHIYPLQNTIYWTAMPRHRLIKDYYVVEKAGKYGLINNNGLLIMDMIQDRMLYVVDENELMGITVDVPDMPFTIYQPGGGRGTSRIKIYLDQQLNTVMVEYFGHDGPSSYLPFERFVNHVKDYPLLPYQTAERCEKADYGCAPVGVSSQYGFMDSHGNIIVEPRYDDVYLMEGPLIAVQKDGLWGYVDTTGKEVIPLQYTGILPVYDTVKPYPCVDDTYVILRNTDGKFGVLSLEGSQLVPFAYDWIAPYFDGRVILKKNGKWTAKKI